MNFTDKVFDGAEVVLDGNTFTKCTFRNCNIHYAGGGFEVSNVQFGPGISIFVGGPALRTMAFAGFVLNAIPEGKELLNDLIKRAASATGVKAN